MNGSNLAASQQGLLDILDVEPFSESDRACFDELRAVLKRHEAAARFGISLLHRHFDVHEGEVLVEYCDIEARTLTIVPKPADALGDVQLIETNWRLDLNAATGECVRSCVQYCPTQSGRHLGGSHSGQHE